MLVYDVLSGCGQDRALKRGSHQSEPVTFLCNLDGALLAKLGVYSTLILQLELSLLSLISTAFSNGDLS